MKEDLRLLVGVSLCVFMAVALMILSGCAMLRDACQPARLVPMIGGGYQYYLEQCP